MHDDILKKIEDYSISLGFEDIKVTELNKLNFYSANLRHFIKKKYYGEMDWIEKKAKIREHPNNMWSEAKSALVFSFNYGPEFNPLPETNKIDKGYISIYARRKDYHKVIKSKLKKLARDLSSDLRIKVKVFVDTAPIMEKPLAELSGIGWYGKHSNIVSKKYGSWLFLGIILTNKRFLYKKEIKRNCGKCKSCIEICPTKAFDSSYKLNAKKCISYLTIEHKTQIDINYREAIGNRIFGCDDCLSVCPWNKFAKKHREIKFNIIKDLELPSLEKLVSFDAIKYRSFFSGTPIRRLGFERFLRNVLIAIGNSRKTKFSHLVLEKLDHESEIVKSIAVWSLYNINKEAFFKEKKNRYNREKSYLVKKEWERFS